MNNENNQTEQTTNVTPNEVVNNTNNVENTQPVMTPVSEPVVEAVSENTTETPVVTAVEVKPTEVPTPVENTDNNAMVNENLKKVEVNYTPPSKFKMAMTIIMFILLIAFVVFLPEITSMVNAYKAGKYTAPDEKITTGRLECKLETSTANLDVNYYRTFKFSDNKLNSANFEIVTKGDATLDVDSLKELSTKCEILKEGAEGLNGVEISCKLANEKFTETQSYVYANIDLDKIDAAFTEAGGTYPEFEDGQDMDKLEKMMNASGYTCERIG